MVANSVASVAPLIEECSSKGTQTAHEIVEALKQVGTPTPVDHAVMSFIYGFVMQMTTELMVNKMPVPTPQMWMGYVIMSLKTLQIGAQAQIESGGDNTKFLESVTRATAEFAAEYTKANSGKTQTEG